MINEDHVEQSISKTLKGESNLTNEILAIRGFSTPSIRMLINNLCNTECTYLEAGVLMGGTFVSSFNKDCISIGFEDFSQDFRADIPGYSKQELEQNIEASKERAKEIYMHHGSFLEADKTTLPSNIDIYFMDAEHGLQNQSVALPEFFDNMANTFLYIVDDANWATVSDGTGVGFKFLRKKMWIEKQWTLGEGENYHPVWHNGVHIYLVKKILNG